jgi:signal transduction histidine kinase
MVDTESILIVDDSPTNLAMLTQVLKSTGLALQVARDGETAIAHILQSLPAMILLDVQMQGMDGFETCRRLKAYPITQDIPVIFMTAMTDTQSKVKGFALGAVDYITKPYEQEEVLARIRTQLELRRLTRSLQQANETLEQRVAERTAELQNAQIKLVQQEKLAALGQMMAGIAHELNNPIGAIASNVNPAYEHVADLTTALRLYQEHYPASDPALAEALTRLNLEFVIQDLPKLLNTVKLSSQRIRELSTSLRNFARTDANTKVAANLHEGIDSTLVILGHRLKASGDRPAVGVFKQYADLPDVPCYPGPLNQVFMNLLANAIDALEDQPDPMICVITEQSNHDRAIVRIVDNGCGMSDEVQQRLFEPLFTTKERGKGTGLGLSIARQIIEEKHRGHLTCVSTVGQGTEFVIELPINC